MVILCVGGDKRYEYLSEMLRSIGEVYTIGIKGSKDKIDKYEDMPEKADVLVLPLMGKGMEVVCGEVSYPLAAIAGYVKTGGIVLGGRLTNEQQALFAKLDLESADYLKSGSLAVKNSIPTAEGTLAIAIENIDDTVFGSNVLITGWGRTAKCCARLFKSSGAYCTVAARRSEALADAWTESADVIKISELAAKADKYDIIINTVPAMVLTEEVLLNVKENCLVIDLASIPGGTDFEAAKRLGIRTIHALALPGKTAPKAAGRMIYETIIDILEERGVKCDKGDKT